MAFPSALETIRSLQKVGSGWLGAGGGGSGRVFNPPSLPSRSQSLSSLSKPLTITSRASLRRRFYLLKIRSLSAWGAGGGGGGRVPTLSSRLVCSV